MTIPQALAGHEHRLIQTLLVNLLWNHGRHLHAQVARAVLHADPVVVHAVPATARVDVLDEHLLQKPAAWTFLKSESESLFTAPVQVFKEICLPRTLTDRINNRLINTAKEKCINIKDRRGKRKCLTIFLARTREGHRQSDKHWNCWKRWGTIRECHRQSHEHLNCWKR